MKKLQDALATYERAHDRAEAALTHEGYAATKRILKTEREAAHDLYKVVVDIMTSNL